MTAAINDVLALLLEIGALVAIAQGVHTIAGPGLAGWLLPALAVIAVVALWGIFAAPKSSRRLKGEALIVFKALVFSAASLSLLVSAGAAWAVAFAALAAVQIGLAVATNRL